MRDCFIVKQIPHAMTLEKLDDYLINSCDAITRVNISLQFVQTSCALLLCELKKKWNLSIVGDVHCSQTWLHECRQWESTSAFQNFPANTCVTFAVTLNKNRVLWSLSGKTFHLLVLKSLMISYFLQKLLKTIINVIKLKALSVCFLHFHHYENVRIFTNLETLRDKE